MIETNVPISDIKPSADVLPEKKLENSEHKDERSTPSPVLKTQEPVEELSEEERQMRLVSINAWRLCYKEIITRKI